MVLKKREIWSLWPSASSHHPFPSVRLQHQPALERWLSRTAVSRVSYQSTEAMFWAEIGVDEETICP